MLVINNGRVNLYIIMRILGITIPEKKRLEIGLTDVFGVGRARAHTILKEAGVDFGVLPKDVSSDDEAKIRAAIEDGELKVEGELKRQIAMDIKRLKDIRSYRGSRHSKHLSVRGQTTKTNSRTVRGNVRRTMGSGKKSLEKT